MFENDISENIQKLVEQHGDRVAIDTKECVLWKMEHSDCVGCPSELGCSKTVKMMLTMMMPMMYEPKSFDDFERMHRRIAELNHRILNAKTREEVDAVSDF